MSIILKKIMVDGYKNLIECEADLADLNILVGPNNSGKSNFLEIFSLLSTLLYGSDNNRKNIFESARTPRGDSSICHLEGHICKPVSFSFLLHKIIDDSVVEIEYSLKIKCKDFTIKPQTKDEYLGFLSEELTYKDKNKPGKATTLIKRDGLSLVLRSQKGNPIAHVIDSATPAITYANMILSSNDKLDDNFISALATIHELLDVTIISASPNEIRDNIGNSHKLLLNKNRKTSSFDILPVIKDIHSNKKLYTKFNNILCKILDLESSTFFTFQLPKEIQTKDSPDFIEWFGLKAHGQKIAHVGNFSDGTLMVIALLAILLSPSRKGHLICIEEPENCLHPKALKVLITFLKSQSLNAQLLITTHSPTVLNQVPPEKVIVARVYDDGGTRFESIENVKELNRKLRKGFFTFGEMLETEFKDDEEVIF